MNIKQLYLKSREFAVKNGHKVSNELDDFFLWCTANKIVIKAEIDEYTVFKNRYYKDDGTHPNYISGLPLPTDVDGVVRHKHFIDCDFHPECTVVPFEECIFESCSRVPSKDPSNKII